MADVVDQQDRQCRLCRDETVRKNIVVANPKAVVTTRPYVDWTIRRQKAKWCWPLRMVQP
jgi:hypothetical protein